MKKYFVLFFLSGSYLIAGAQARSLSDSIQELLRGAVAPVSLAYTAKSSSYTSLNTYTNPIASLRMRQVMSNATQLAADSTERLGTLRADYRFIKGGLHLAQDAYRAHKASLYTEGLSTLGKTRIAGSFSVSKLWEDSLANLLAGYSDQFSPYYYFATKAGKYQGQRYTMSMVLSHPVSRKVSLGFGADYDYRWTTRSVDPRPDDRKIFVNIHPSVSMRFGKTVAGIEYTGGYERGTISIIYQNTMFNLSTLYPERFYYLNMGYGNIALKYGVIGRRSGSNNGVDLHLATTMGGYEIKADAGLHIREEVNERNLDTATLSTFFSRFNTDQYRLNLTAVKNTSSVLMQWALQAEILTGADVNSLYNGSNYFAHQYDVRLQYSCQVNKGNHSQAMAGASVHFSDIFKQDILAAHEVRYISLQPGISLGMQRRYNNKDVLAISLEPSIVLPLSAEWHVPPTQENVFTRAVVYPDYYYYSSTLLSAGFRAQYSTYGLLRTLPSGFFLEADWLQSVSTPGTGVPPQADRTGKNRFSVQLGFQVFL